MVKQGVLIYDGGCGLCQWSVRFVQKRDRNAVFSYASSQSPVGKALLEKSNLGIPTEVILLQQGNIFKGPVALIRLLKELPQPWSFLGRVLQLIPVSISRSIYDFVARNRYLFPKDQCSIT
jgi:predicted DCC family thiol-disulfide oxidoreductase YuxK